MQVANHNRWYTAVLFFLLSLFFVAVGTSGSKQLSIKLKAKAVILGPEITLGDVGYIIAADSVKREQLMSIKIGDAPPPGESSDISLSHIKRCLKTAGFSKYVHAIKGPRTIRVITAPVEIDKAFLREEYACNRGLAPVAGKRA